MPTTVCSGSSCERPPRPTEAGRFVAGSLPELGRVLTRLGSRRGIELLVRITEGKPAGDSKEPGSTDAKAPPSDRVEEWQRQTALRFLNDLVVAASPAIEGDTRPRRKRGPWGRWYWDKELDYVSPEVRAWWKASRGRVRFDPQSRRWQLKPK